MLRWWRRIQLMGRRYDKKDAAFQVNWSYATNWSTEMRYRPPGSSDKDEWNMTIAALTDTDKGVITWLKTHL